MMNRFDDLAKEEIRARADIASVIGRYVNLKGSGGSLKGLCPFHKEKTPSFHVNTTKGFFHCFGCGKGGDVFSFLQEIEGIQFPDALKILAEETGVELKKEVQQESRHEDKNKNGLILSKTEMLAINEIASKFYYSQIRNSQEAIDYFKSRGLTGETVRDFRLGFAPQGWSTLISFCQSKNISQKALVECGLAIEKEGGGCYDRFRNRAMFTLTDLSGKVIGFAGRGMEENAIPKYLNSPETLLYKKKHFLYGLHKARQTVKECGQLMIVEGYMDYLTLCQSGIKNIAATSGTALTPEHAQIIQRFTSKVVLVFDGDSAGQNAAVKGIFVLAPFNLDISVLVLPDNEDPDSFVKKYGSGKFLELVKKAQFWMSFIIKKALADNDTSTPRGKSAVVEFLNPLVKEIKNPIAQSNFKKEIAEHLEIKEQLMYTRLQGTISNNIVKETSSENDDYLFTLEGSFLRILVTSPELILEAKKYVLPETLTDNRSSDIYFLLLETYAEKGSLEGIVDKAEDLEIKRIITLLLVKPALQEHIHEELVQKIIHLRAKFLKASIREIRLQMKNAPDRRIDLLQKLKEFSTQLKDLDAKND